jgi:hypothetical protein
MNNIDTEERLKLIRDVHLITPGLPGMECTAQEDRTEQVFPVIVDGWVACPVCGNALGRVGQLMIPVLDVDPSQRPDTREISYATYHFI